MKWLLLVACLLLASLFLLLVDYPRHLEVVWKP